MTTNVCSIQGCTRTSRSRGWCNAHYGRWHRAWGDPPTEPRETGLHLEPGERRKGVIVQHECEDCGAETLAGGRWCWPCFKGHAGEAAA